MIIAYHNVKFSVKDKSFILTQLSNIAIEDIIKWLEEHPSSEFTYKKKIGRTWKNRTLISLAAISDILLDIYRAELGLYTCGGMSYGLEIEHVNWIYARNKAIDRYVEFCRTSDTHMQTMVRYQETIDVKL